ncbi:MAG: hypothetical protein NC033_03290 [Clostridiales bacterium]|nr:hypothetical protein [Clostridiales bacterium]
MSKKFIKPLILLVAMLLALSVIFFTACDPASYNYDLDNLRAPVKSVELVNYDNPSQKHFASWVPDHSGKLKPLNISEIQTTATLETDRIDGFMQDLAEKRILYKYYAYDSPEGVCIKIGYGDDCFDIISAGYIGTFSADGKVVDFIGWFSSSSSFDYLLNTYFGV